MERNKMIGLLLVLTMAFSSFVYLLSAPPAPPSGEFTLNVTGTVTGVNNRYALVAGVYDENLPVLANYGPYLLVPADENVLTRVADRGGIYWVDANVYVAFDVKGARYEGNLTAYVLPGKSAGDVVPLDLYVLLVNGRIERYFAMERIT